MELLKQRILTDGRCLGGGILKVDSFLNHQIDPKLMESIGREFVCRFGDVRVDKVLTVEASGIAPALMVASLLGVDLLFAKKKQPSTIEAPLSARITSFTKGCECDMCVSGNFLKQGERVLFIDDFLANGSVALGILDIVSQAGAEVVGMGFVVEKSFQSGAALLAERGVRVESLARIASLDNCQILFAE
ncbi:MAG: xanthine phosphoribosyltransferase [Alistipes sp.]|nr:xanthine phosphoribosyltransferase [Alistipes sp.]